MTDPVTDVPSEETLVDAMARLRALGYTNDLSATDDGHLACVQCGTRMDPIEMRVDHTVRFEGDSNPADEAILLAIGCACGCLGIYTAGYGTSAPKHDAVVLRRLARREQR